MFLAVSTLPCQPETTVCMEARPLGWCAGSKIWSQISLLPLPSEHPLPQNRHGGSVEVFLEFLESF